MASDKTKKAVVPSTYCMNPKRTLEDPALRQCHKTFLSINKLECLPLAGENKKF
jgi:hypothetical protein